MKEYTDYYKADKGKHFILTEKGKEWASYRNYTVGEPIDEDDRYGYKSMVEDGALIEVDDPDWVTMPGYRAVYDSYGPKGKYTFDVGNHVVYPFREMAEAAASKFQPWENHSKGYVIDAVYEGKRPKPCREYKGKKVYNRDCWTYAFLPGSLVEEEIVNDAINCVPPVCMRSDCMQCGEPAGTRIDENGQGRNTYLTFKRISKDIYEYCGKCFKGENVIRGEEIPIV